MGSQIRCVDFHVLPHRPCIWHSRECPASAHSPLRGCALPDQLSLRRPSLPLSAPSALFLNVFFQTHVPERGNDLSSCRRWQFGGVGGMGCAGAGGSGMTLVALGKGVELLGVCPRGPALGPGPRIAVFPLISSGSGS